MFSNIDTNIMPHNFITTTHVAHQQKAFGILKVFTRFCDCKLEKFATDAVYVKSNATSIKSYKTIWQSKYKIKLGKHLIKIGNMNLTI